MISTTDAGSLFGLKFSCNVLSVCLWIGSGWAWFPSCWTTLGDEVTINSLRFGSIQWNTVLRNGGKG